MARNNATKPNKTSRQCAAAGSACFFAAAGGVCEPTLRGYVGHGERLKILAAKKITASWPIGFTIEWIPDWQQLEILVNEVPVPDEPDSLLTIWFHRVSDRPLQFNSPQDRAYDRLLKALTPEMLNCSTPEQLDGIVRLIRVVGDHRQATNTQIATEWGASYSGLFPTIRRCKEAGILTTDDGRRLGGSGARKQWWINRDRIEALLGSNATAAPHGHTNCLSNGTTTRHSAKQLNDDPPALPKPKWDAGRGELRLGEKSWSVAKQARRIREALDKFEQQGWPEKVDSPCTDNPQAHKDVIRGLKKCAFLTFASALSGTAIAWKTSGA